MNTSQRIPVSAAAAYVGLSESTLNKLRLSGGGPRYLKITPRRVTYDTADLDEWLASKRRMSTSDAGVAQVAA